MPAPTFQWLKNGAAIAGWTNSTLSLEGVSTNDIAAYSVIATNSAGSATSAPAFLSVTTKSVAAAPAVGDSVETEMIVTPSAAFEPQSRLVNLSVRSEAGVGNDSLIVGFVVSGSATKSLLVRGIGPTLGDYGVAGSLADPTLSLYSGSAMVGTNDNWSSAVEVSEIVSSTTNVGAFVLPSSSRDAVMLKTLGAGVYTAEVSSNGSVRGAALIELYDTNRTSDTRLVNLSVRTMVNPGSTPIVGFVVDGTATKKLLVRAVGPGLASLGVSDVLADPQLHIYRDSIPQQRNDNWGGTAEMMETFTQVGAFPLNDAASKDAALIFIAQPGAHTVVVSGVNNATGVVVLEVYEVQ
jgi:hypothetical protein